MDNPAISICYPTYNRSTMIYANVTFLLNEYEGVDIEVIVLNNNSTDDTEEKVLSIKDKRLKYFRNKENIGSQNLIAILRKASAPYALLISDEDTIDVEALKNIITIVKKNTSIGMIFAAADAGGFLRCGQEGIYTRGKAIEVLEDHTYMSGLIYNVKNVCYELSGIDDNSIADVYGKGYGFLMLAMLIAGKHGMICTEDVICKNTYDGERDYKTYMYLKDTKDVIYEQRIEQAQKYIDILTRIPLSAMEISMSVNRIAVQFVRMLTASHVSSMKNRVKMKMEDGKDFYWPPIDKNFKPREVVKRFIKDYYEYIYRKGLISKVRLILCTIKTPMKNVKLLYRAIKGIRNAEIMMRTL